MDEHYRLQLFDFHATCLAINWASAYGANRAVGDCVVLAIRAATDVDAHNRTRGQRQRYTEPMALADARRFVEAMKHLLGSRVHDCIGIVLEDDGAYPVVAFDPPIEVRA
ncbi:MAG: hypothetical protein Q7R80_04540 [bacterium]|nr:hypothetical protein [bacterium]